MVKRNANMTRLNPTYLFPEINARKQQFLGKNPQAQLISLGIGDTTEPLPPVIAKALAATAEGLATREGYTGYSPEQGILPLREKIASRLYHNQIQPDEIFISDGAKCDLGRLQTLFGSDVTIAVQDPTYPVYVDGSLIRGVKRIIPMPCTPENDFFPDLTIVPAADLIYFCSPNNPTGAVANRKQLEQLVQFAKAHRSILIFDSAYAPYIQDPKIPKSIYEIDGAREVAIEISSFSKMAGFTGVRLGWTVVPEQLKFENGESVKADWRRVTSTIFNGASNIAQRGGCAILEEPGWSEVQEMAKFYLENTSLLQEALRAKGVQVFGGVNAPYLWIRFPGKKSWDIFQDLMENLHIITTPGSGFGSSGEGFVRLSAFGHRENILEAVRRISIAKM